MIWFSPPLSCPKSWVKKQTTLVAWSFFNFFFDQKLIVFFFWSLIVAPFVAHFSSCSIHTCLEDRQTGGTTKRTPARAWWARAASAACRSVSARGNNSAPPAPFPWWWWPGTGSPSNRTNLQHSSWAIIGLMSSNGECVKTSPLALNVLNKLNWTLYRTIYTKCQTFTTYSWPE